MAITTERSLQMDYWKEHTVELSVEAMMLDSQASTLDKEERPEILSLLPPYSGKSVIELGAGIGRFTGELAKTAGHVLAMDFMENAIKKNEKVNGHNRNVEFRCADVTSKDLKIPEASADLVFSNWLLMYLADEEVKELARNIISWLRVGGHVFFRESCYHQSGDHKRKNNPTHYREPRFYNKIFEECHFLENDGTYSELRLIQCKCVGAYVRNKRNQNQICWLWTKVPSAGPEGKTIQRFLDSSQYTQNGILRYERIFGNGFVSTGGLETTKEFVAMLDLHKGDKVLDVGCGIGGGDFYMADTYEVEVVGIDLSVNMISIALERVIGLKYNVEFEICDCTKKVYPEHSFDVIYSRDTLLHIREKPKLFRNFYKWLKPGGRLLISDYCKAPGTPSAEFKQYIEQRGYDLPDVEQYGQILRDAGFQDVVAQDRTHQFMEVLEKELSSTLNARDAFVQDFSEEDYQAIVSGWQAKLQRCARGEQKWGLFVAHKSKE